MAAEWEGKSKGTVLGYKIYIFFIKYLGLNASYLLLHFVVFYYCIFSLKSSRAIYYYLRKRQGYSKTKSLFSIYKSYYVFGQTLIDRATISAGLRERFTYEFDGIENIERLLVQKKGGILLSAHAGNFEVSEYFLEDVSEISQISVVTWDTEHEQIKSYMETVKAKSNVKFILVKEDLSHIFEIHDSLSKGELVCFTGDRFLEGSKFQEELFLGKKAKFPLGPFLLASRLKVPVLFVYVMKEPKKKYHLYARTSTAKKRDADALLKEYTENLEWILEKYPLQWFNYFDFWNDKSQQ
ncbi:lipid A biosynthesis acyltransferase [Flavobacteriaceae bacterium TP-CH-4]|uniref:Lipid A biosynthesis acyltransferase n=1 Tax=Pelagihabitans pacificus TaxID=2696054 RepID=A0A967AWC4_9FLAO|nr:lipid A biosynthesis acyltransferase [Pelagihabitans pacificus]NHF60575.1 lipid A biosynthesis acyltransferase [Pelagihabitans pacificus]